MYSPWGFPVTPELLNYDHCSAVSHTSMRKAIKIHAEGWHTNMYKYLDTGPFANIQMF